MKHQPNRTRMPLTVDVLERFLPNVDRSGECWLWTGKKDGDGYGMLYALGGDFRAHRVAYEIAFDKSPGSLFVCHRCDNPACVRPSHLFLGTNKENTADRHAKGRDARGPRARPDLSVRGEHHGQAKLTDEDVRTIRRERAAGVTQRALQTRFGVSQGTISHIQSGKSWRHVI